MPCVIEGPLRATTGGEGRRRCEATTRLGAPAGCCHGGRGHAPPLHTVGALTGRSTSVRGLVRPHASATRREHMKKPSEITFGNIASSACGGIAAGMVLSFAGAAGTIIGAALGPVVFMLAKELARRPAEGAAALTARSTRRGASGMTATDAASGESAEPRPPRPARPAGC